MEGSRKIKLKLSQSWSDRVLAWQAGVFVLGENSMHRHEGESVQWLPDPASCSVYE